MILLPSRRRDRMVHVAYAVLKLTAEKKIEANRKERKKVCKLLAQGIEQIRGDSYWILDTRAVRKGITCRVLQYYNDSIYI